jgi:hypothetical protein
MWFLVATDWAVVPMKPSVPSRECWAEPSMRWFVCDVVLSWGCGSWLGMWCSADIFPSVVADTSSIPAAPQNNLAVEKT